MTPKIYREMFRHFLFSFLFITASLVSVSTSVYGQAGTYYDALNTSASTFVGDLKGRVRSPYTKVSYDNFDETFVANFAAINNGNGTKSVICVYSSYEYIYTGTFSWGVMSREHTFCHSWMPSYSSTSGDEYADQHHLFPTQQNNANGVRSNHPLGVVANVTSSFIDCKLGTNTQGQTVFEPRDKQKGDAARAILYMLVKYDGVSGTWNMNWLNNTRLPSLSEAPQSLETLLAWHRQDPPDKYEVDRGNYVQTVQKNRNPFVDHPEYVNYINFNDLTKLSPVYSTEPANYPADLTASSTSSGITVNWTDATGTSLPSGYLVQIYSANNYFLPIDGEIYTDDTNLTDGKGIVNVSHTGGSNSYTYNGLSASTTYYITIFSYNGTGASRNYKINGTLPQISKATGASTNTVLNFTASSATVNENAGAVNITVAITNPGAATATTVQVVRISGDSTDINNYAAQTLTFPPGSSAPQSAVVTVTDDSLLEGDEAFVFKLQNAAGGTNVSVGANNTFTLTVNDNDLTTVQFTSGSATVGEASGTYNLNLIIANPSPAAATVATVALISGNPPDIGNYTTQTVTFPAGSSANRTVTVTITDDSTAEPTEVFEFSIETVTGGNSAQAGAQSGFTLAVMDNEGIEINLLDDFNRAPGNTVGSTPTSPVSLTWGERETVAGTSISITDNQLKMSSATGGKDFAYLDMSALNFYPVTLSAANGFVTWAFNMKHSRPDPSGFDAGNYGIAFVLAKSTNTTDGGTGYAVVHGNSGSTDPIRLAKFSAGLNSNSVITNIISGGDYGNTYNSVKVVFDPSNSTWYLYVDSSSAGFPYSDPRNTSTLIGSGTADNTYINASLPFLGCMWNHNVTGTESAVFDDIFISDPGAILPVELVSFKAVNSGNRVMLNWTTASETNNRGFEIQRVSASLDNPVSTSLDNPVSTSLDNPVSTSLDNHVSTSLDNPVSTSLDNRSESSGNQEWLYVGFVEGQGNSVAESYYTYSDNITAPGSYSYRLKQIDNDGSFSYSQVVSVNVPAPEKFELAQNYPNPFNPGTVIKYELPISTHVRLTIYDMLGNQVANLVDGNLEAGVHETEFNASRLPSGIYFYSLTAGEYKQTRKMTLLK